MIVSSKQLPVVLDRFYNLIPIWVTLFGQSKVFENFINFILGKKCADVFFSTGGGGFLLSEPPYFFFSWTFPKQQACFFGILRFSNKLTDLFLEQPQFPLKSNIIHQKSISQRESGICSSWSDRLRGSSLAWPSLSRYSFSTCWNSTLSSRHHPNVHFPAITNSSENWKWDAGNAMINTLSKN